MSTSKPHFRIKHRRAPPLIHHPPQDANSGLGVVGPDLTRSLQRTRAALQLELCGLTLERLFAHQPSPQLQVLQSSQAPAPFPLKRAAGRRVKIRRNAGPKSSCSRHPIFNHRQPCGGAFFWSTCCLYSCCRRFPFTCSAVTPPFPSKFNKIN